MPNVGGFFFRNVFSITVVVRYRIASYRIIDKGEARRAHRDWERGRRTKSESEKGVNGSARFLCGTDTGTGHVDLLPFAPRTASRVIGDLPQRWWTGECITREAMPCWHQLVQSCGVASYWDATRDGKGRARSLRLRV